MSISKVDCAGPAEEDKTARGITNEMDAKFRRAMDDEGIIATKPLQDELFPTRFGMFRSLALA
jgi:hypothetical protein